MQADIQDLARALAADSPDAGEVADALAAMRASRAESARIARQIPRRARALRESLLVPVQRAYRGPYGKRNRAVPPELPVTRRQVRTDRLTDAYDRLAELAADAAQAAEWSRSRRVREWASVGDALHAHLETVLIESAQGDAPDWSELTGIEPDADIDELADLIESDGGWRVIDDCGQANENHRVEAAVRTLAGETAVDRETGAAVTARADCGGMCGECPRCEIQIVLSAGEDPEECCEPEILTAGGWPEEWE